MIFDPPLIPAVLLRRYKRFLFDAVLSDGSEITGFCPNTGSMRGLTAPGSRVWLSDHEGSGRKHRYALELVETDGTVVGINTALPNRLAEEAILKGLVPQFGAFADLRREQRYGRNSRIDILLQNASGPNIYVEAKNVHFIRSPALAEFPDSVTTRGAKHLEELGDMVEAGHRAAMLFVVQRNDCERLRICGDLDPAYGRAFARAVTRGVEAYAVRCFADSSKIVPDKLIKIDEPGLPAL
ncbi:DNA/RNA nuclease SfsA [Peteryoungia desertarenae]|uniref:Sugar fermentation stimulation protein homolog n=1 Tax=Peteryoungia desertarenae TaxID=1813451 RepID=A0ABX6QQ97_9HYPH|nr:DNA/RNA nuclease SfsA [Peteryoungia desertarenae]QLF70315.1 DNA/RNA nuclease SfsA [Peteryoungia desertarenae]